MKIEKSTYEGYLWYSDKTSPEVYNHEELELEIDETQNPFIVEGQLYDADKMRSISIKYVDGKYIYKEYSVESADFNRTDVTIKSYLSNRMDGLQLQFLQYWREEQDGLCEDWSVLQPAEFVFVGFVKE